MLTLSDSQIKTVTGRVVDFLDIPNSEIEEGDIIHGIAHTCRFSGQINRFYSVAQHSVMVSRILASWGLPPEIQMVGLFHDAAEAYMGDVPRPLKILLPDYKEIEQRLLARIGQVLDLPLHPMHHTVKEADRVALDVESMLLREGFKEDKIAILPAYQPDAAKRLFIDRMEATRRRLDPPDPVPAASSASSSSS